MTSQASSTRSFARIAVPVRGGAHNSRTPSLAPLISPTSKQTSAACRCRQGRGRQIDGREEEGRGSGAKSKLWHLAISYHEFVRKLLGHCCEISNWLGKMKRGSVNFENDSSVGVFPFLIFFAILQRYRRALIVIVAPFLVVFSGGNSLRFCPCLRRHPSPPPPSSSSLCLGFGWLVGLVGASSSSPGCGGGGRLEG